MSGIYDLTNCGRNLILYQFLKLITLIPLPLSDTQWCVFVRRISRSYSTAIQT